MSQPSKQGGTREGQTLKIQVPTFNVPTSQSDSQGQRKPPVKKTKHVDSQVYLIIKMLLINSKHFFQLSLRVSSQRAYSVYLYDNICPTYELRLRNQNRVVRNKF